MTQHTVKRLAYAALSLTFLVSQLLVNWIHPFALPEMWAIVVLTFAAYRLGRMMSYDLIFETYRSPFVVTGPDPTGAGDTTFPRVENGIVEALGNLLCCPICTATWVSALLLDLYQFVPVLVLGLSLIFALAGGAELLGATTEFLEWRGQAAREDAGALARERNRAEVRKILEEAES